MAEENLYQYDEEFRDSIATVDKSGKRIWIYPKMLTPARTTILAILLLVVLIAAWSKLRIADEDDHQPQRWLIDEHPAFRKDKKGV